MIPITIATPLHFLYKEVCEKDCRLVVSNGRVYRTAVSVKLYIRTANAYWLETAREYANGPVAQRRIEKVQSHTLSETMTAGEKPLNCVLRCLAEEPGIVDVNPAELKDVSIFGEVVFMSRQCIQES